MASNQSSDSSLFRIQILIVDDDSTTLSVVSSMLKAFCCRDNHKLELLVVTIKNPLDALSTLQSKNYVFDLVITDLHMPQMNGMELKKHVHEEFNLPVIIMSSDDSENVILRSLEGGAAFYIVKPVNKDDIKSVWHYAVATKTGKSLSIKEIGWSGEPFSINEDVSSAINNEIRKYGTKEGRQRTEEDKEVEIHQPATKKQKLIWTNALHNRFLQAIHHIGLDKAVPKRILECMSVRGLAREHIASHLQKYRIFLRKVAERGGISSRRLSGRSLGSNLAPFSMLKNVQREYSPVTRASIQPGLGGSTIPALGGSSFRGLLSPNQQAPSNNYLFRSPHSQSLLFGNANSANGAGANLPSHGGVPHGLTHGTSPMQMYQPQNQARSYLQNFGGPLLNRVGAVGITNNSLNTNNNYAGIRVTTDGHLIRSGQMQLNNNGLSNGFSNGGHPGWMKWASNGNMNAACMGFNIASPSYMDQRGSFSSGFVGANQFFPPPPFTSVYDGNTPMLPPPSQHQLGLGYGGQNDFVFGLTNNSPSILLGESSNQQPQIGQGELNVSDMVLEPPNNPPAYQVENGAEGSMNPIRESDANSMDEYFPDNEQASTIYTNSTLRKHN
uniref:Response regulatory domain-containing protein n=1 Tax=Salix viminalis TaxID=40686 RepID=A0A6N2KBD3_SALVM